MKKFKKWFAFMVAIVAMIACSGTAFAIADDPAITSPVGDLDGGPGQGVAGDNNRTQSQEIMEGQMQDFDYYQKQINKHIVEMKLESCPIDQILRSSSKTNKSSDIRVKYYQIGQRPIKTTLRTAITATTNGAPNAITPVNNTCFDSMDTIIFPEIMGYVDGTTRETLKPLMVRVVGRDMSLNPIVIALNGKKNDSQGNRWDLPDIPAGATMLRLGRAAGEKDVETASYYELPESSEQYCQRYIMQAEESVIERMSQKIVDWDFSKQERVAMDDMRDGIERSGLFGIKSVSRFGKNGNVYTTGGIYWEAGKDLQLGHWQPKLEIDEDGNKKAVTVEVANPDYDSTDPTSKETITKTVYEYAISEKELTNFINLAIQNAGNGSRTKLLFVDNLIYMALSNLKSQRRIIMQTESNYNNWHLDFESFTSMGTKILIYRHDSFNYMGMSGCAFLLDPRYLEKWVFGDWSRKEYDLKDLFIRNSNAVVMEEFSCWTLYFPNAHARVSRPDFDKDGVTDEIEMAA